MKAVIELNADEFTESAFDEIRQLLKKRVNARVRISIEDNVRFPAKQTKEEYFASLDKSIKQVEEGNVITFTWEEFEAYGKKLLAES